ncbi:hypothetical protein Sru01_06810 [Sphaerisporangium rufum]|uniref:Uncharacterized protein n=1 Tax=Sphaerisporangium rufum TaxID=1381558 RepID=A0A919QX17_9ACTN|nr:hypothetical protein Sru01_06810 [Sphaerisporangium rufum]
MAWSAPLSGSPGPEYRPADRLWIAGRETAGRRPGDGRETGGAGARGRAERAPPAGRARGGTRPDGAMSARQAGTAGHGAGGGVGDDGVGVMVGGMVGRGGT